MQSAVRSQMLVSGTTKPSQVQITGTFYTMCEAYAGLGGYSANAVCQFVTQSYIMPSGSSGYFGLRPGAVCSSLGECSALPADCRLRVTDGAPLLNVTGALDMCSAEGIVNGSALPGVATVAGEPVKWSAQFILSFTAHFHINAQHRCSFLVHSNPHLGPAW